MRTRIAQIAPNLIQEIDRIAQIVRTNEPSFSSARLFIILHTNRVDSADAEKDFRESTVRISDCRASNFFEICSRESRFCKRGEFVQNHTKPLVRIAWHF